jgi:hypothetical protein
MPSVVTICNAALSHIGDSAAVSSVFPPDGSAQAEYCNKFYPLALKALLEMSNWGFATVRATLAEAATNPSSTWKYAYAYPNQVVKVIAVLWPDALDDYSENLGQVTPWVQFPNPEPNYSNPAANFYAPQPYVVEQDGEGNPIILTNVANAVARYTTMIEDPNKFSGLFVLALTYMLASLLAGPIIKGDAGSAKCAEMLKTCEAFLAQAKSSDADQRKTEVRQSVPWMARR